VQKKIPGRQLGSPAIHHLATCLMVKLQEQPEITLIVPGLYNSQAQQDLLLAWQASLSCNEKVCERRSVSPVVDIQNANVSPVTLFSSYGPIASSRDLAARRGEKSDFLSRPNRLRRSPGAISKGSQLNPGYVIPTQAG